MDRVLAVFRPDLIDALVEPAIVVDPERLAEEIGLRIGMGELGERDHGGAVERAGTEEVGEGRPSDVEELVGEVRRTREGEFGRVMLE